MEFCHVVVDMLSCGLKWWAPGGKAGPTQGNSGACNAMQCTWVTVRGELRSHPFPDLMQGLAVEARVSCWRSLHTWGLLKVSSFFLLFLCPQLLQLEQIFTCCSLGPWCSAVTAAFSTVTRVHLFTPMPPLVLERKQIKLAGFYWLISSSENAWTFFHFTCYCSLTLIFIMGLHTTYGKNTRNAQRVKLLNLRTYYQQYQWSSRWSQLS